MSTPSPLRLESIRICGYRAFPHPVDIPLKGKSLVLYGENGSGKSSLGKAVRDLLSVGKDAPKFDDHRYRYSAPSENRAVAVRFTDSSVPTLMWDPTGRGTVHPHFSNMASARGWFDYRAVWRASEVPTWSDHVEVFKVLVEELIGGCESPILRGGFGTAWNRIKTTAEEKRPTRSAGTKHVLERLWSDIKAFNQALEAFLPDIEKQANVFLEDFAPWTKLTLTWKRGVSYEPSHRHNKLSLGIVELRMQHRDGQSLKTPSDVLNEARLTAIGLSLYLSGLSKTVPARQISSPSILVLDDVLLSLDMAHRLPLLRILRERFSSWQVLLLTHDRAWYEIARQQLNNGWIHHELFTQQVGDYEQPLLRQDQDHLGWAIDFLAQGHVKAAAVHVRTKFEEVLKWACCELGLAVKYHPDPRKMSAKDFWAAVSGATWEDVPPVGRATDGHGKLRWWQPTPNKKPVVPTALKERIAHALSWVMNPLSHSHSVDRYRAEIEDAIFAVNELEQAIREAIVTRQAGPVLLREMLLAIIKHRTP
ncbi:MAG: hypothetical protein HZA93_19735 [Verrucomicrobia bacterium]|nr:hypothetical protein [Verrucomicrobiota bacterium]